MSIQLLAGSIQLLVGAVVLAGFASASAQIVPPGAHGPAKARSRVLEPRATDFQLGPGKPRSKDPYARLFSLKQAQPAPRKWDGSEPPKRKTVCGLTVWNVEPDLDPRILLKPRDKSVDFKIEKLAPPVCQQ